MKILTKGRIYPLALMGVLLMIISSCYKAGINSDISPIINPINVPDTVTDIDSNVYHTIIIGTQVWMVENLKTTKFRNGDPIPNAIDSAQWNNITTGAYCIFNNAPNNNVGYGYFYNWHAVHDTRNIAPSGWHVATDDEWTYLINYLGGRDIAGGKLKEEGNAHWFIPNTGATNSSGFTALPAGRRTNDGSYIERGSFSYWWTSTEYSDNAGAWCRRTDYSNSTVQVMAELKSYGLSVRCVKD